MIPVSQGKPYAGNPHVRFEEGASAQAAPRRSALLHTRNRQSVRKTGGMRGDPSAEALSYKQVSRSASEPLPLSLVIVKTPCGQRVILREAEKKRRSRFAARKAWRGIDGRRVWKVASGTWETCPCASRGAGVGWSRSSGEAGNDRGAKGSCLHGVSNGDGRTRLADADQTSMRMCNELGRLVAHTSLPNQYIYTVPVGEFIERGAYRRSWDIPILDRPRRADMLRKIFEMSLEREQRRVLNQNLPGEVKR